MAFTASEIKEIRQETSGTKQVAHFNNAGASLMPDPVRDAMIGYLQHESMYGSYETARTFAVQLEHTYDAVAELINASKEEIALVSSATVAWNLAFQSLFFQAGDIILTSNAEYASNYINFLHLQRRAGVVIRAIPNDKHGQIDVQALDKMITPNVKLIAITHIPTNGGLINPAAAIGQVAKRHKITYLLDACQSVGQIPIDVEAIGCDFLSATGRKYLRAPRGTGFLYVKKSWLEVNIEPPTLDLHAAEWVSKNKYIIRPDARRFESWESNLAGKYGLGLAIDYALSIGIDRISHRLRELATLLRTKLSSIQGITVHDIGKRKGGIVSFSIENKTNQAVLDFLLEKGINVSLISKNGTLLDSELRELGDNMVRASVHYYNTESEIGRLCNSLKGFIKE